MLGGADKKSMKLMAKAARQESKGKTEKAAKTVAKVDARQTKMADKAPKGLGSVMAKPALKSSPIAKLGSRIGGVGAGGARALGMGMKKGGKAASKAKCK